MEPEPLPSEAPPAGFESGMTEMPDVEEKVVEAAEDEDEPKKQMKEPEFTGSMSQNEALNAAQGASDEHVPEDLFTGQLNPEVFAECKVPGNVKVTLKLAVWDGRTVGVTVKVTPKNKKIETCLDSVARKIEWKEKAKSITPFSWGM